jgi:ribosomal protein S18 acetylase RimI-like enzyme
VPNPPSAAEPQSGQARELELRGIRICRAGPPDWATLREVRLAALADSPAAFGSTVERERAFDEAEWRRRAALPWFLAWHGDEPVGIVAALSLTRPADGDPDPSWGLFSMRVAPAFRGRGVAEQLAAAVVKHARGEGAARLILWVADGNDRARAFYLRLGFRPTGARQTYQRQDGTELHENELALDFS